MKSTTIEFYRSVSDDGGDFDDTEAHEFTKTEARQFIMFELEEAGVKSPGRRARLFTWTEPKFLEFDSGNPSHACGYWEVEITGPDADVEAIERHYEE
jgi:hypothetical protein